jgi:predicted negative regulator of RcsB-dependent stress response
VARSRKIRRKDLRQPDEFLTLSRQVGTYVAENRTLVLTVSGAVLFVVLAFLTYHAISVNRESRAAAAYHAAQALMADRKYEAAAAAFRDLAEGYRGSSHAKLAKLEQANALLMVKRTAEAALAYQQFLDAGPPADYLRQLALTRLAYTSEQRGDPADAATRFAAAAATLGPFTGDAVLGEARAAQKVGETDKARALYKRFLDEYPASDRRELVMARLRELGGEPSSATPEAPADAAS